MGSSRGLKCNLKNILKLITTFYVGSIPFYTCYFEHFTFLRYFKINKDATCFSLKKKATLLYIIAMQPLRRPQGIFEPK